MNNNNMPDRHPSYDDEISLVDLATTLIRRRRVFYVVFLLTTLAGLAYALLLLPHSYDYVTLFQLAEQDSGKTIESPATTIATLESRWLPEIEANHQSVKGEKLPFKVSFSNPESTGLIRITSEASPDNAALVESIHGKLIEQLKERQQSLVAREKQSLEARIAATDQAVESLKGTENTGAAIAEAYGRRVELEGKLAALQPGETLVVGRKSTESTGTSRSLIVVLAVLLGGMLGVFLAFFSEFVATVRQQFRQDAAG